jgi:predicted nucleic acid-binding Zn ribbon protein
VIDVDPRPLTDSLDSLLRSLQRGVRPAAGSAKAMGGVFGRWDEIVGEAVAARVRPVRLDGTRLVVEVSDPGWATQVRVLSEKLRERIRDVTGTDVETVEVRVATPRR